MASGKDMVADLIKNKKVVVVSKSYCPFCVKAKVSAKRDFDGLLVASKTS